MARFTIPPFTRLLLVVLTFFTLSMAVFRYYLFIHAIHHQNTTPIEQSNRYLQKRNTLEVYGEALQSLIKKDNVPEEKVIQTENTNQNQNQDQSAKSETKNLQRVYKQSYSSSPSKKSKDYIKFNSIALPFLVMVPGIGILRYPWVIVTSSFIEETLLNFIITGGILLFSGRYLEHMWGSTEMAKFILIQTLIPNIGTTLFTLIFKTYDPLCQLGTCHGKHDDDKERHIPNQPVSITQPTSTVNSAEVEYAEQTTKTDKDQDKDEKLKRDEIPNDQKKTEDSDKISTVKTASFLSAIISPGVDRWVIINGGSAYVSGFLVAFKQLVPEHTVALFQGSIRFKVARIPVVYFIAIFLGIFIEKWTKHCALALWGFFSSWIYLRFYRKQNVEPISPFATSNSGVGFAENSSRLSSRGTYNTASRSVPDLSTTGESSSSQDGSTSNNNKPITNSIHPQQAPHQIRGDASDYFSFAQFFPEPISILVEKIENTIMNLLYAIKVCTPFSAQEIEMANIRTQMRISGAGGGSGYVSINPYDYSRFPHLDSQLVSSTSSSATGGSRSMNNIVSNTRLERSNSMRAEAERRRALALKAFDLNHKKSSSSVSSSSSKNESK